MLALAWRYLTGRSVAIDIADRRSPEWPPHPDRVFQALTDAWGTRGEDPDERAALEWLESLAPPHVVAPDGEEAVWQGAAPTVFVPTNDIEGTRRSEYGDKQLALLPRHRKRKGRTFPCMVVGDATCALVWPDADAAAFRTALARLAAQVTRIGHSSSLVRCWLEENPPSATWIPAAPRETPDLHLRVVHPGRLRALTAAYADGAERWRRPPMAPFLPYREATPSGRPRAENAGRMVVLRRIAGAPVSLSSVVALTRGVRRKLMRHATGDGLAMISGHAADGPPLKEAHLGIVPLPFVGAPYADGHLLGLALVMPSDASYERQDGILRALAAALDPDTDALTLPAPGGRTVSFAVEDRAAPPRALRPSTWARGSRTWATTTPIVLDRMPPRRTRDRDAFMRCEIGRACERISLPHPTHVAVGDVSPLVGVPHAAAFPPLPTKSGQRRRHVHAVIRFATPVAGPVILGAGRFRGLGLLRPTADIQLASVELDKAELYAQDAP